MAEQPPHLPEPWTKRDATLKQLAKEITPPRVISLKMGPTPSAVQSHFPEIGVSLHPANQSPYIGKPR